MIFDCGFETGGISDLRCIMDEPSVRILSGKKINSLQHIVLPRRELATCRSVWLSCTSQHGTSKQKLKYHVTFNFYNNTSTAAVFLNVEKAFNPTWYLGLLYKLFKLQFSASVIQLISSFLSDRKFQSFG